MKIAMIGQKGIPALYGGIERHVEDLSRELSKQGHEVLAYARNWYSNEIIKNYRGIRVIHTPSLHTKHLDAITHTFTATMHAIKEKVNIIHYHGVGPALLSWIPRILAPEIKVVATFHCIDRYHQKWNWFARLMLRLGEKAACLFPHETIGVSKTIKNYCLNEYDKNIKYIPNGINIADTPVTSSLLYQWNIKPGKYFLMVSRLVKHKGAHYLIDAWQTARQREPELFNDYKLVIVGDSAFTDGYVAKIKRMAAGDQSIVFTGWQNGQALDELYGNAAMLIHPSENEGLSLTVLQAMAMSKAVLVSDIAEQQELIVDKKFRFANTDIFALADKIIAIAKNPEWLEAAGKSNRQTTEKKYNWEHIAKNISDLYQSFDKKPVSVLYRHSNV